MKNKRAIVFIAWGDSFIQEVEKCCKNSVIPACDLILITDMSTAISEIGFYTVIRVDFQRTGLFRKTELIDYLPIGYDSYLLLDSDTRILLDIEMGFVKAEEYGMAIVPAPHYSLDYFWDFGEVMAAEGLALQGQLQYNSGVIFFSLREDVQQVFQLWKKYGKKYDGTHHTDQPFLTLAFEQLKFNPFVLSHSYNYRGFGDLISGVIRIWHSHFESPNEINSFESAWPPRRAIRSVLITPKMDSSLVIALEGRKDNSDGSIDVSPSQGKYHNKNFWVFCCGMYRSGSTLQYQLTSSLIEKLAIGVRSDYLPEPDFGKLLDKYENTSGFTVLKAHVITPAMLDLLNNGKAFSIGCFRDLRDVAVSMMHFWDISFDEVFQNKLDQAIEGFDKWSQYPGHMASKYEQMILDPTTEITRIANHLGIQCKETLLQEIAEDHSLDKQRERVEDVARKKSLAGAQVANWDPRTLLYFNHISSGSRDAWKSELSKEQVEKLETKYGDWLVNHGYYLSSTVSNEENDTLNYGADLTVVAKIKSNINDVRGDSSMAFISYAQNYEDVILARAFAGKTDGFYIDIGACFPDEGSVTKHFYDLGWRGINVEPHPEAYKLIAKQRINDINLNIAIAEKNGQAKLYYGNSIGETTAVAGENSLSFTVPAMSLKTLCEVYAHTDVDFLKVDVEGYEYIVLKSADWKNFHPKVIICEVTYPWSNEIRPDAKEIISLLSEYDYKMAYFDGLNYYFVTQDAGGLHELISLQPNVIDNFISQVEYDLRVQLQTSQVDINNIRAALRTTAVERDNFNRQLKEVSADRATVRTALETAIVERDNTRTQFDEVWSDRENIKTKLDNIWADREKIQVQLNEARIDHEKIRNSLETTAAERENIRTKFDEVWSDRENIKIQLDNVWTDREKIQVQLNEARIDHEKIRNSLETTAAERENIRTKFEEIWAELTHARTALETKTIELNKMRIHLDEVWIDRKKIQTHLDEVWADRENIRSQRDEIWADRENILSSFSWRLIFPLRAASRVSRYLLKKLKQFMSHLLLFLKSGLKKNIKFIAKHTLINLAGLLRTVAPRLYTRLSANEKLHQIYWRFSQTRPPQEIPFHEEKLTILPKVESTFNQKLQTAVEDWKLGERVHD